MAVGISVGVRVGETDGVGALVGVAVGMVVGIAVCFGNGVSVAIAVGTGSEDMVGVALTVASVADVFVAIREGTPAVCVATEVLVAVASTSVSSTLDVAVDVSSGSSVEQAITSNDVRSTLITPRVSNPNGI